MNVQAAKDLGWIAARTGCVLTPHAKGVEAVQDVGGGWQRVRGQVAFDCWTENACQAHMAVETPIAWRALLPAALSYAFEEAGKGLILAVIARSNERSLRFTSAIGFTQKHRIKDGWAKGEDLICFEMRREDCRYLPNPYRKAA